MHLNNYSELWGRSNQSFIRVHITKVRDNFDSGFQLGITVLNNAAYHSHSFYVFFTRATNKIKSVTNVVYN